MRKAKLVCKSDGLSDSSFFLFQKNLIYGSMTQVQRSSVHICRQ